MRKPLFSLVCALLLVTAGVGGPFSTPAAAATYGENCSALDNFIHDLLTFQNVNEDPDNPCSTQAKVNQAVQDMKESDANQTKVDIYTGASEHVGNEETFRSVHRNYLEDSEPAAWMKMQVAVAEAYQNGSSEAEARVAARQAISNYYAVKEVNVIERWNHSMSSTQTFADTAESEDDISRTYVGPEGVTSHSGQKDWIHDDGDTYIVGTNSTSTYTLVNGTTRDATALKVRASDAGGADFFYSIYVDDGAKNVTEPTNGETDEVTHIEVQAPNSNYDDLHYIRLDDYGRSLEKIDTMNSNLQAEADTFVNATYADFETGEINASDVISANTAMFEYGVRSNSSSDSLYNSVGALTMMGYDTPNINSSGTMDVTYNGNTYTGLLMAQNAPNGSWSANTTYNTSDFDGPVFIATTTGNKVDIAENSTFTVDSMRARDGSEVKTIETTKYVYKTANTTEVNQLQQQLRELRQQIEDREPDGSGAGGTGGLLDGKNVLVLLAAAAGAALLMRDN